MSFQSHLLYGGHNTTTECFLTGTISHWFGNSTRQALLRVVPSAQHSIRTALPHLPQALQDNRKKKDTSQPNNGLISLLHYCTLKASFCGEVSFFKLSDTFTWTLCLVTILGQLLDQQSISSSLLPLSGSLNGCIQFQCHVIISDIHSSFHDEATSFLAVL